jgi:hypothetical protein
VSFTKFIFKRGITMRSACCLFLALFAFALVAPGPVYSSNEQSISAGKEIQSGKDAAIESAEPESRGGGEGLEPAAKEGAKEEEVPPTFGPIVTDTAVPIEKGHFAIQPTFGYSAVLDSFNGSWNRTSAGGDFRSFGMDWKLTYGPIENMEVYVVIPWVYNRGRDVDEPGPNGERSASSSGLGDVNLTLKYRLMRETPTIPTVTVLFSTDFPTGRYKDLDPNLLGTDTVGGGSYVFTTGLNLSKYVKPFILYANLWYSFPTTYRDDEGGRYPSDFITFNVAAEYPLIEKWVALLELTSHWGVGRMFGPPHNVPTDSLISIVPGIEYMATDKFSLALGLNIDLVGKDTDAAIGPLFSMVYSF